MSKQFNNLQEKKEYLEEKIDRELRDVLYKTSSGVRIVIEDDKLYTDYGYKDVERDDITDEPVEVTLLNIREMLNFYALD